MIRADAGTIELIAIQIAQPLIALNDRFKSGETKTIFAEMGVQFPADLDSHGQFSSSLSNMLSILANLPKDISDLIDAINDEDGAQIASSIADILLGIKDGISSFDDLSSALTAYANTKSGTEQTVFLQFAAQLPEKLLAYSYITLVDENVPVLAKMMELFGIIEQTEKNIGSGDPLKPAYVEKTLHLDRLGSLLTSPGELLKNMYGWGDNSFNETLLLDKIGKLIASANIPILLDNVTDPPLLDMILLEIKPERIAGKPNGISFNLAESFNQTTHVTGSGWNLEIKADVNAPTNSRLVVEPDGNLELIPPTPSSLSGDLFLNWSVTPIAPDQPFIIIGKAGGNRWEFEELSIGLGSSLSWNNSSGAALGEFRTEASVKKCKVVISTEGSDGFLSSVLPLNSESEFDLTVGISSESGLYIQGSAAFEISLPLHISLGPVEIETLIIALKFKDGKIPVELGADFKLMLGPMVAVVNNIGLIATFSFPPKDGNLGPLQLDLGFKPPNGIGLSLDTPVFKGGGYLYLDFDKGEYMGALELDFKGMISLKAIGIINTIMPDGSEGFSLLIIITSEFSPIQLAYGFTLNGVGGLLGLHRTTKIEILKEGVKTNAIKSILFPEDIVANITRIVSDIKQVFPPYESHFVVGPMAKIGWGIPSIITLELGILLEIPVPRIAILGVLKAVLPEENTAILRLQINFLGVLDFENKYISFDASLYDSRLLVFTLTGDMAFRLSWGDKPLFIISVGGFHPSFKEAPSDLKSMKRLSISLLGGSNPRITIECYYAVTSNTVQFGAKAELYAAACGFNVYGFIGYDVLFQFEPFRFIADIYAKLALRRGSSVLMSIRLKGTLSGPTPWDVRGEASFSILFFDITIDFHETWGDRPESIEKEKKDLLQLLTDEVNDYRNWVSDIPDNNQLYASIKEIDQSEDKPVIHPFGILTFSERKIPLNITIDKYGTMIPLNENKFELTDVSSNSDSLATQGTKEQFARANFKEMSDSEKLSYPSFEELNSGFIITGSKNLQLPTAVNKSVDYELSYLKKKQFFLVFAGIYKIGKAAFKSFVKGCAMAKTSLSYQNNRISANAPEPIDIIDENYFIANVSDMQIHSPELSASSYTEANELYRELINQKPELKDQVQILSEYETSIT
ncbi:MAG: hypothetical protein GY855_06815 [candidate division Zixibacteria bacterium]|nr:hypothetical protein [candidate division Zixibacteria bacterium]